MGELGGWAASTAATEADPDRQRALADGADGDRRDHRVPLVYDFYGFPAHYYEHDLRRAAGAPELAATSSGLMPANEPVLDRPTRGLDHGAGCRSRRCTRTRTSRSSRCRCRTSIREHLFEVGRRLAPLRDEGVLIVGSGFMTHGLPFVHEYFMGKPGAPQWSVDFDQWATRGARPRRRRHALRLPREGAGDALRASDGRAFRAAVRDARRGREAGRRAGLRDRGVLFGLSKRSFEAR